MQLHSVPHAISGGMKVNLFYHWNLIKVERLQKVASYVLGATDGDSALCTADQQTSQSYLFLL